MKKGGTELEFDPWCSRWDAILFIVLIISEYIVRTRHAVRRAAEYARFIRSKRLHRPRLRPRWLAVSFLLFAVRALLPRPGLFLSAVSAAGVRVDARNLRVRGKLIASVNSVRLKFTLTICDFGSPSYRQIAIFSSALDRCENKSLALRRVLLTPGVRNVGVQINLQSR